jgi:hypothetical protein
MNSDIYSSFSYTNVVLLIFSQVTHPQKLQLDQALRACYLEKVVSVQALHYHVQTAKAKVLKEKQASDDDEGLLTVDCSQMLRGSSIATGPTGSSSATSTTSPLTENSSCLSAAPSVEQPPIKRRKSSKQACQARVMKKKATDDYDHRFKQAFKIGTNLVHERLHGTNNQQAASEFGSVAEIVTKLNEQFELNGGGKKLSKSTLHRSVKAGHVGASPLKRGPAPKIPDILLDVVASHSEVSQVGNGGELRGRDIKRMLKAAVLGTKFESTFTVEAAWKKLRNRHPERVQAATKVTMDEGRSKWTTVNNLEQWFDDVKVDLNNSGLVIDREVRDAEGLLLSELDFRSLEVERRIINMDETHHDLSITGDKGGPRALVYTNPKLQRGYKKTVKPGRHVTGVYATNAAGEALPPMYIFDSGAKIDSNYRVKLSWLEGLPVIQGRFGCPDRVEVASFYSVRARGSMDDSLFNDYVERVVLPLYPNISKTAKFDPNTGKLLAAARQLLYRK